jgi:hypothetical protein
MGAERTFGAVVQKDGSRTFIAVPFDPDVAWGKKQRHHVTGTINGCRFRGPLGSNGTTRVIVLGAAWRRDMGIEAGDQVTVTLRAEGPQQSTLAADVARALAAEPRAQDFFNSLATFYRKGYVNWIEGAKRPATRAARIAEMIALLKAGKKQR